jgi:hypothetical protein
MVDEEVMAGLSGIGLNSGPVWGCGSVGGRLGALCRFFINEGGSEQATIGLQTTCWVDHDDATRIGGFEKLVAALHGGPAAQGDATGLAIIDRDFIAMTDLELSLLIEFLDGDPAAAGVSHLNAGVLGCRCSSSLFLSAGG